jgi:hypothetical protein
VHGASLDKADLMGLGWLNVNISLYRITDLFIPGFLQWCAGKWLANKKPLLCSACQLLWCKYSHHGQFQVRSMT